MRIQDEKPDASRLSIVINTKHRKGKHATANAYRSPLRIKVLRQLTPLVFQLIPTVEKMKQESIRKPLKK